MSADNPIFGQNRDFATAPRVSSATPLADLGERFTLMSAQQKMAKNRPLTVVEQKTYDRHVAKLQSTQPVKPS